MFQLIEMEVSQMSIILMLLGTILFLPNYANALDERLQRERTFEPLNVIENLNSSIKASKSLAFFGLILCSIGIALFIASDESRPLSIGDRVKAVSAFFTLWLGILLGHLRAQELKTCSSPVKFTSKILFRSTALAWRYGLKQSLRDISCIVALVAAVIFIS